MIDAQIIALHQQGISQYKSAIALGCSVKTIRRSWKRLGLKGKSTGIRTYQINEHIFDIIDTEERAYWLGFILADGCAAKSARTRRAMRVFLKEADQHHLQKLAKFWNYQGKLHPDDRKGHPRLGIVFNSVPLLQQLIKMGWLEFKEYGDIGILSYVPDILRNHLVRGYLDGDGSITRGKQRKAWHTYIVSQHTPPLQVFADWVHQYTGILRQVKPHGTIHKIRWNGRGQLKSVLDWVYKGATVYLERKYARMQECLGATAYIWNNMADFAFELTTNDLLARRDRDALIAQFTALVQHSSWVSPIYDMGADLAACRRINLDNYVGNNCIYNLQSPGNNIIVTMQPRIWEVSLNGSIPLADFNTRPRAVARAVKQFMTQPDSRMYPKRLIRELQHVGFTRASILSVPVIMTIFKLFGLSGRWFDPCAGWGNRLLAAYLMGLEYEGTDPGICYDGLVRLRDWLWSSAVLYNLSWQEVEWPRADVVFTSPPFYNKEDYLDGTAYGTFEEWYLSFLRPLANKALSAGARCVFHTDEAMRARLERDFQIWAVPLVSKSARKKVSREWFVEISSAGRSCI